MNDVLCDIKAEQAILGSILQTEGGAKAMLSVWNSELKTTDFYNSGHAKLFGIMLELYEANQVIDLVTLNEACIQRNITEICGKSALEYLDYLCDAVPTAENVLYYVDIVRNLAIKREIRHKLNILVNEFDHAETNELSEKIDEIQALVSEMHAETEIETLDSFLTREKTNTPYIVSDILPSQGYMLLAGASGEGKTTIAMQLCLSVLTNTSFFGSNTLIPNTHILYLNFENSEYSLHKLIEAQIKAYNPSREQLRRLYIPNCEAIDFEKELNYVQRLVRDHHIELVVVDPITWGITSDPNDYRQVLKLIKRLKRVKNTENNEISWLLVHHFRKPTIGNNDPLHRVLGSTGWVNCATSIITLERYAETRNPLYKRLDYIKLRDAKPKDAITIAINEQSRCFELVVNMEAIGTDKVLKVLDENEPMTYRNLVQAICQRYLIAERSAKRLISKALDAELICASNGLYSKSFSK